MVSPGTQSFDFSPQSEWIWGNTATPERNEWRMFRYPLHIQKHVVRATLLITADTFYELYLNGSFIGRGPARGFAFAYPYDVYTVDADLIFGADCDCGAGQCAQRQHFELYQREGGSGG